MPEGHIKEEYLGDGVYARFDGYHIVLFTQEGTQLFIEDAVFQSLLNYAQAINKFYNMNAFPTEAKP